jgi:hypothetical protein
MHPTDATQHWLRMQLAHWVGRRHFANLTDRVAVQNCTGKVSCGLHPSPQATFRGN